MTKKTMAVLVAIGLSIGMSGAVYADSLVTNGGFEVTTNGNGQMGNTTNANGWTTTGYNFIFAPHTADTTGANGQFGGLTLWGPGTHSNNGLPAASPSGGNFVAADGAFNTAPITQTINGLIVGKSYVVGFDWAAAQQSGFTGDTTDQWIVALGGETHSTAVVNNVSHGFSGWQHENFTYVATASSETLSFLANGTPTGVPPFAVLDGVSMEQTPEPTALVALFAGSIGLGLFARRRARTVKFGS